MRFASVAVLSLSTLLFACSNESNVNTKENVPPIALEDLQQEWQLMSINNSNTEIASTLNVDSQAQATGNLACNNFFGTIELQANKLRIDKMGSTRRMCEPEINDVEMTVSSTLSSWSEVQLNGQTLTITGDHHTLVYSNK